MELISGYDSEVYSDVDNEKVEYDSNLAPLIKSSQNNSNKVCLAPEVNAEIGKSVVALYDSSKSNNNQTAQNDAHIRSIVTGLVSEHKISLHQFDDQMHSYNASGYTMDPSDTSGTKYIFKPENNLIKSTFTGVSRTQKDYIMKLKKTREKYGNPATGDFKGPWSKYQGEELFTNQGELSEEQKEALARMEHQRKVKAELSLKSTENEPIKVSIT